MSLSRRALPGLLSAVLLCSLTQSALAQDTAAEQVIRQTTEEMLVLIEESKAYVDEDQERFFQAVEDLLIPVVNFPRFARSVMAAYYKDATLEQQERFSERFQTTLVRTYALALTEFDGGEVVILPNDRPSRRPDRASVQQEIRMSTGDVYPVVYSMALSEDQQWQISNIIVSGVNMGLTYRNQFAGAIQDSKNDGDMDKVIDAWAVSIEDSSENDEA